MLQVARKAAMDCNRLQSEDLQPARPAEAHQLGSAQDRLRLTELCAPTLILFFFLIVFLIVILILILIESVLRI